MAIKLDLNKAFDLVEWLFLWRVLLAYAFIQNGLIWSSNASPQSLTELKLIDVLVTKLTLKWGFNREICFLFISLLWWLRFSLEFSQKLPIKVFWKVSKLPLLQLLFLFFFFIADYALLFAKAEPVEASELLNILNSYASASSQ